ncbi:MAG: serine/threonine-protein kinase bud32 [Trizodia sp. TS-e1964]|nr:MAG: serine/threonine-protein kinase bud32 [Trizodia sp. TS-e1964]
MAAPPPLPPPYTSTSPPPTPLFTGAESHIYQSTHLLPTRPCILKHRPPKPYRHPTLDARLTRHRLLAEARALLKARAARVPVPALYALDVPNALLVLEYLPHPTARAVLCSLQEQEGQEGGEQVMRDVGRVVGRLHGAGIVHGDLTTSNLLVEREPGRAGKVWVLDFGLAVQSCGEEERAVDLYGLERAVGAMHPRVGLEALLEGYLEGVGGGEGEAVLKRLRGVRARGRKRSMLG